MTENDTQENIDTMAEKKWVTMWANATSIAERRPENYAKNLTLRYPLYIPFSGKQLRVTFSNYCGTEPIRIARAYVAVATGDQTIDVQSSREITFQGKRDVTIADGTETVSDSVDFLASQGQKLMVSFYLEDFTQMRSTVLITGPLSKGAFAVGDYVQARKLPAKDRKSTNWFYFLNKVELLTKDTNRTVICYGDSITSQDWPDDLMLRLAQMGKTDTAIVRRAVSGTRVLREYDCITYASYGLKGADRFCREVGSVSGADTVLIQHGINDIIHPVGREVNQFRPWSDLPTAQELIGGLHTYIQDAVKMGLKVYAGTLLPIQGWRTDAPFREQLRSEVNEWLRTTTEIDGCVDFDRALRDEHNPAGFAPGYDSGDHLHPSKSAYERMAQEACERLFG